MGNQEKEIWYDVQGFDGLYEYSNLLRFRSLPRIKIRSDGIKRTVPGKILKITKPNGSYAKISFKKQPRGQVSIKVHRFFAKAFIQNPNKYKYVNHKNGDKHDYSLNNLEWVTKSEDVKHAIRTGLMKRGCGQESSKHRIILDCQTGVFYFGCREAAAIVGLSDSGLYKMLNGQRKNKTSLIYA